MEAQTGAAVRDPLRVMLATRLDDHDTIRLKAGFPTVDFVEAYEDEDVTRQIPSCEAIFTGRIATETLANAPKLRWVHARSAGVNGYPLRELADRGILLTTSSGAHGTPIAENILAMMLAFATRLHLLRDAQNQCHWEKGEIGDHKFELEGQTLLVIGLGGIGAALARKASALRLNVIGMRRSGGPAPEWVDELIPSAKLMEALPRADHIALCLPLTPETTAFLTAEHFGAMKPSAYVYNVGRGKSIEREALLRALNDGWIAGAGLDVTDPEPLAPDDPLWSFPNVILTQHTSGGSPKNSNRVTDIFMDNLVRYMNREPLLNVVDLRGEY